MIRTIAAATLLAAAIALPAAAQSSQGIATLGTTPSGNAGPATANQTPTTTGTGTNAAASVTQPGTAQTPNSGQSQNGNYGTGIAGGRADPNPFPAAK